MSQRKKLQDPFGRKIDYLRVSVTDRCNFRCGYCMPREGVPFIDHEQILTFEELLRIASVASELGMRRLRLTGGEPLVRKGIVDLVRSLREKVTGLDDLAMTTNAALLGDMAESLRDAGLDRVNISLDTLDPQKFADITRIGNLPDVLNGIQAAARVGLRPIKLNAVLMEGINDDPESVGQLLDFARECGATLRFIELMPIGITDPHLEGRYVPADRVIASLQEAGELGEPVSPMKNGGGPAVYYRLPGGGQLGFITALSHDFCDRCSRLRLTADGKIYPCLASPEYIDVRGPLRSGAGRYELAELIRLAVRSKPGRHHFIELDESRRKRMSKMGG